jgi:hypothetical protein
VELILWLTALHAKNIQLDDWCGQGKLSLLTGSYFKSSGCVPDASWFRNYNRATFDLSRPSHYLNINEGSARSRVEI